ncbi:MAG: hypothetical protein QNJ16_03010 [Rhodobacter sp.]|nr:hypothetical protein [Rhodobacter sp.]
MNHVWHRFAQAFKFLYGLPSALLISGAIIETFRFLEIIGAAARKFRQISNAWWDWLFSVLRLEFEFDSDMLTVTSLLTLPLLTTFIHRLFWKGNRKIPDLFLPRGNNIIFWSILSYTSTIIIILSFDVTVEILEIFRAGAFRAIAIAFIFLSSAVLVGALFFLVMLLYGTILHLFPNLERFFLSAGRLIFVTFVIIGMILFVGQYIVLLMPENIGGNLREWVIDFHQDKFEGEKKFAEEMLLVILAIIYLLIIILSPLQKVSIYIVCWVGLFWVSDSVGFWLDEYALPFLNEL